jgi:hypothetical protein
MTNEDIAEMVCDWAAIAEEKKTSLLDWTTNYLQKH